uniref:Peptide-N(4)-(N-acetyl-beta-glucosaminyl)asparagine amidase n=1 Tax=Daphnia lumholtzi TaxID=42856 RepID=A0A4Y7MAS1_9CRUS|nr:EOG090X06HD [Daphnia lumholtzi]SVE78239.1 EOG090X06HD [Daphnia lumholtzi]SVE78868.1 EOG090X06HD [Daphnia lumholtzi]
MSHSHLQIEFLQRLAINSRHVLKYENAELQSKAKACVPLPDLLARAQQNCSSNSKSDSKVLRDALLIELLTWFKESFFSWFDAAHCRTCDKPMQSVGSGVPSADDLRYGAHRVENFKCNLCNATDRFPRYNDPEKLLQTRRGRCGEWANCFTLICRALKYDARYVLDWTDHVWTEVYSERHNRWLHCDSCEAACDKPLLYDVGWGKRLNYVIAFSKDEVQDVTWRYTRNHAEVIKRRNLVSEEWLLQQTNKLSRQLQSSVSDSQRELLTLRLVGELAEFLLPREVKEGEEQGRTSGAVSWRQTRGEMGMFQQEHKPVIWTPSEAEMTNGEFALEYSASLDKYVRRSDGDSVTDKWSNGVYQAKSVFRKTENDWKMAYLARAEGSSEACLSWKFDLSSTNLVILQATVSCPGTTFEDGEICWKICGSDHCQLLENGCVDFEVDLSGSKWCVLSVEMSRGRGANAWQHTQIARQSTKELNHFPLSLRIFFGSLD